MRLRLRHGLWVVKQPWDRRYVSAILVVILPFSVDIVGYSSETSKLKVGDVLSELRVLEPGGRRCLGRVVGQSRARRARSFG